MVHTKRPLHSDSFHYKGYWNRVEMFGSGWKVFIVKKGEPSFYMEIVPQNCDDLDVKRYVKEWIRILSVGDKK